VTRPDDLQAQRPLLPSGGPAAAEAKAALASEMAAEVLRARGRVAALDARLEER
jgi:hypothetical protein